MYFSLPIPSLAVVQSRGLFNDPAAEINSLVFEIKEDINDLNSKLDEAQQYVTSHKRALGGPKSQPANHSDNVVGQLKTELLQTTKTFKVSIPHVFFQAFNLCLLSIRSQFAPRQQMIELGRG
jgi:hypothetical protein